MLSVVFPVAPRLLEATRSPRPVENCCHWVLDVTLADDASRIRKDNSPQNMAVLRTIALNFLKQDTSPASLKQKSYPAPLDDAFLFHFLTQL